MLKRGIFPNVGPSGKQGFSNQWKRERSMYLSIQECIDMSDLTEDEILAIS